MTTSNAIETAKIPNVLYIPIEAVNTDSGITVVFTSDGADVRKQEIETGTMSDDEVVVLRGLDEGDRVLLAAPLGAETMTIARLTGPSIKSKTIPGDSARATVLQSSSANGAVVPPLTPGAAAPAAKKP
jgi:hypothetical protein